MTPPLPASSSLCVGFRGSPFGPFEFTIPDGAENDIGFLKLFVSTCPLDMSSVVQDSPFLLADQISLGGSGFARGGRVVAREADASVDTWDAYRYDVTVRRAAVSGCC